MDLTQTESHDMSKNSPQDSADTLSNDDNALMTRLGLLFGDRRASTVKTQNHPHPILSHPNHSNTIGYLSSERRKKPHLTTSPASTLSDKGIGSSVGSFDSEFRRNLSVLAETNSFPCRTGSLDSRNTDIVSHSRSDSGIPSHSRSSSDIVGSENTSDVTEPRLAKQSGEKLWNADPRRNSGNTQSLLPPEVRPRRPSVGKSRKSADRSSNSSRERLDSASDVMKLPQLCLDSPNNSTGPSTHSSVSSSRSVTPAVSVCDVTNYKGIRRSMSSHSNGTAVFDPSEPLPPPPPPPPSNGFYGQYGDSLPPPPPPPPADEISNHSRASSSDRTVSCEDFQQNGNFAPLVQEDFKNQNFLHVNPVIVKPPISRNGRQGNGNGHYYPKGNVNQNQPPIPAPRSISRNAGSPYESDSTPSMIQRLRSSSDVNGSIRTMTSQKDDGTMRGRLQQREWPHQQSHNHNDVAHMTSSISSMSMRAENTGRIPYDDHVPRNAPHLAHRGQLWDESRPHSLSAPPAPVLQNFDHRPSASIDNSYFSRRSSNRSSTRSNQSNERKIPLSNASSSSDMRAVRFAPYRQPDINLHALQFELPSVLTTETRFIGREWVFGEIMTALNNANSKINKGVIIIGNDGRGKTAIIRQLEAYSYHGNKKLGHASSNSTISRPEHESLQRVGSMNGPGRSGSPSSRQYYHHGNQSNNSSRTASPAFGYAGSRPGSRSGSQTSLTGEEAQKRIASQVVAYHYCQADNNTTCYVPEFLHSIAAQLTQAPQLTAYRELLIAQPHLQTLLSLRNCIQNPSQAFFKAILEPLITLRQTHKLPRLNLVILLDGIGEAEQYRSDHGHSILSFLHRYLAEFPDFLKIIATCRTADKDLLQSLPFYTISIDMEDNKTHVTRDVQSYISHRISASSTLSNLTLTGKPDAAVAHKLLSTHLLGKCQGNMLYLRLTLDLIETGKLVPKSSGFKVVPVNMSEVFLLMCNLKFNSASSFARVRDILAVAVASLYPFNDDQFYQAVCSGLLSNNLPMEDFHRMVESVSQFLVIRSSDERRSFFHPCFREWLATGSSDENHMGTISSSKKFSVDPKRGHTLLATVLSRQPPSRLNEHAALELAHHLLKARMFRGQSKTTGMNSSDLHAVWMAQCSYQLSESLVTIRNLFFPNIKVSKLILRSGANPNIRSQVLCEAPAICVASHIGCKEFVELLLTYGANIDFPASNGMTSLAYAAAAGHYHVVEMMMRYKPRLDLVDRNGHSPLLHAISHGHGNIAVLLLTCDLYVSPEQRLFSAQQALIAAATTGNSELIQYLLDHPDPALQCDVNCVDPTRSESALTAAASRGKTSTCELLVRERRANIEQRNKVGMTPLLCAVKQGEWETADLLLTMGAKIEGADFAGRTPLITAASYGNLGVVELLLSRGANTNSVDKEGLTALGWAALKGHFHCAKSLIDRGSDIHHPDKHSRTPLDLAAFSGDAQVVDLLLNSGADFAQLDVDNMSALDRAIGSQNVAVVSLLLKRGAGITPMSWKLATAKPDVTTILLARCVEDANTFYKEERYLEARDVYSRALAHVGEPVTSPSSNTDNIQLSSHGHLRDLTAVLLLGLARCARKLSDLESAESAASRALDLKPGWYEALYVRARVLRETSRLSAALCDVIEAETHAPVHNKKEIKRLVERLKEEIKRNDKRNSMSEPSENTIRIRHNSLSGQMLRPRVNSTSSYKVNNSSRSSSPSPSVTSEFPVSNSFQPSSHLRNYTPQQVRQQYQDPRHPTQLPHLYQEATQMRMSHSEDSLNGSGFSNQHNTLQNVPYQHHLRADHYTQVRRRPPVPNDINPVGYGTPTNANYNAAENSHYASVRRTNPANMANGEHYMGNPMNSHPTYRGPENQQPSEATSYRRTVATEL